MTDGASLGTPTATGDRTLAAVAYLLILITGIIVLLIAKRDDTYARWHAIQAIGLGVVVLVVNVLLSIAGAGIAFGGAGPGTALGLFVLTGLFGLLVLVLVIILAVNAYQGEPVRIPVIANFADKNA